MGEQFVTRLDIGDRKECENHLNNIRCDCKQSAIGILKNKRGSKWVHRKKKNILLTTNQNKPTVLANQST